MNAAAERRLTAPLVLAVLVLAALLLALLAGLGRGVQWDPPRPVTTAVSRQAPVRLPPPEPLQHYAEVWQKPLFSPDRKPAARAAGAASNIGDLELTGIIITPGVQLALLRNTKTHDEIRVRQGAALPDGSTTLVELRPRSAVFDAPGGRVELKLPSGAPIDPARGSTTGDDVVIPPPPDEDPRRNSQSRTGLSGEPEDQPPEDDGNSDANGNRRNSMLPSPRNARPAPARSNNTAEQAERIRRLRDAIQKRRARQAAPASHEGDR